MLGELFVHSFLLILISTTFLVLSLFVCPFKDWRIDFTRDDAQTICTSEIKKSHRLHFSSKENNDTLYFDLTSMICVCTKISKNN